MSMRKCVFFVVILLLTPAAAEASVFSVSGPREVGVGQIFEMEALAHTQGQAINAFEGELVFPSELLTLEEIFTGSAAVSLWIEAPQEVSPGRIRFSGVTPGGYNGAKGMLLRARLRAREAGSATLAFENARTLLNDGRGTPADDRTESFKLAVRKQAMEPDAPLPVDIEPPETFLPVVTHDPALFDGRYFLVFVTQDKGMGLDRYEVKEGLHGFVEAQSPYVLRNQRLDGDIFVKAVDRAGNERTVRLAAPRPFGWMISREAVLFVVLIALVTFGILWRRKYIYQHHGG